MNKFSEGGAVATSEVGEAFSSERVESASSLSVGVSRRRHNSKRIQGTFVSNVFNAVVAGGLSRVHAFQLASVATYSVHYSGEMPFGRHDGTFGLILPFLSKTAVYNACIAWIKG
jgi:hypothetical protein